MGFLRNLRVNKSKTYHPQTDKSNPLTNAGLFYSKVLPSQVEKGVL